MDTKQNQKSISLSYTDYPTTIVGKSLQIPLTKRGTQLPSAQQEHMEKLCRRIII
jgi:hypothetical protein